MPHVQVVPKRQCGGTSSETKLVQTQIHNQQSGDLDNGRIYALERDGPGQVANPA